MEAGLTYQAKIQDYGVGETRAGDLKVWVIFKSEDSPESCTWTGTMKEGKAQEITMETLETMGFTGSLESLNAGSKSGALNMTKAFEIFIDNNEFQGQDGQMKTFKRVKWVNDPEHKKGYDRLEPQKVAIKKSLFDSAWKARQISQKPRATKPKASESADADIPF